MFLGKRVGLSLVVISGPHDVRSWTWGLADAEHMCWHRVLSSGAWFGLVSSLSLLFCIPQMNQMTWCLSFSFWLISLRTKNSLSFHLCCCKGWNFIFSYSWVVFHGVSPPHLHYSRICLWAHGFCPDYGYCKWHCSEHRYALYLFELVFSYSLRRYLRGKELHCMVKLFFYYF